MPAAARRFPISSGYACSVRGAASPAAGGGAGGGGDTKSEGVLHGADARLWLGGCGGHNRKDTACKHDVRAGLGGRTVDNAIGKEEAANTRDTSRWCAHQSHDVNLPLHA